jgi:NAD(P)-dependent dehydrogenase (short-subunit alcohol dehydrogenase family)
MNLAGRTVVITGAAGGIGRALALRCAAEGARVAVTDRQACVQTVAKELGHGHVAVVADVTDRLQLSELLSKVESELGVVDVFFANAGIASGAGVVETADDVWDQAFAVNVRAHVLAVQALLPGWLARGEGYFVATASAAGLLTQIGSAPYSVTKHAAVAFAEWLSITYGGHGIRVSCLCPMGVRTTMLEVGEGGALEPLGNRVVLSAGAVLEPAYVASVVIDALADERFLILPHPEVLTYFQRKASDYERWLTGMRHLQGEAEASIASTRGSPGAA